MMSGSLPIIKSQRVCRASTRLNGERRVFCRTTHRLHVARCELKRDVTCCTANTLDAPPLSPSVSVPVFPAPAAGQFSTGLNSFLEQHRVRGNEVGPDQRASIVTVANLLQEIAGNHAVGLWGRTESGFANLPSMQDVIFVMTRLQIRMFKYPKWGDLVELETWFKVESKLSARRDWSIKDCSTGEVIGTATRSAIPLAETKQKFPDLPPVSEMVEGPKQIARRADVDMNGHINNVTYLAWSLEAVPAEVYQSFRLHEVEVDFKAECQAGQVVESHAIKVLDHSNGDGKKQKYIHTLRRCDENTCFELVRARTTWLGI